MGWISSTYCRSIHASNYGVWPQTWSKQTSCCNPAPTSLKSWRSSSPVHFFQFSGHQHLRVHFQPCLCQEKYPATQDFAGSGSSRWADQPEKPPQSRKRVDKASCGIRISRRIENRGDQHDDCFGDGWNWKRLMGPHEAISVHGAAGRNFLRGVLLHVRVRGTFPGASAHGPGLC